MSKPDFKIYIDGLTTALGGVNSGVHPSLLRPDEIFLAENVTLRGGFPRTRPRIYQAALTFQTNEQQAWFATHRLQGGESFVNSQDYTYEIAMAGGRLFQIDVLNGFTVTEITPQRSTKTTADFTVPAVGSTVGVMVAAGDLVFEGYPVFINGKEYLQTLRMGNELLLRNVSDAPGDTISAGTAVICLDANDPLLDQCWMKQVPGYLVIQNNLDGAIVYNGSRASRRPQIPVGAMMEYAQGRLWVVVNRGQVAAGDLFDPFKAESVITFDEEKILDLSGRFVLPDGTGKITGIKVIPNLDTSQGQGPIIVGTETELASINVPIQREQWKTLNYAVVRPVQTNYGFSNQGSIVVVNGDIWNRRIDGLASFVMAAAAFNEWGNVPQSAEISAIIDNDTPELLKYASGILFDNRLLMTYGPTPTPNGIKHRGVVPLDFHTISALTKRDMPAFEGKWTGFNPTVLVTGIFNKKLRAFGYALDADNHNTFWEITDEFGYDNTDSKIASFVETRSFAFAPKKSPFDLCNLIAAEMWVDEAVGETHFRLLWKPDYSPCWFEWKDGPDICVTDKKCDPDPDVCRTLANFNPGYRTRVGFPQPPDDCEPHAQIPARICYRAQLRLEWSGQAAVKALVIKAQETPELEFQPTC